VVVKLQVVKLYVCKFKICSVSFKLLNQHKLIWLKIRVEGFGYVVQKQMVTYKVSFNVSRWNGRLAVLNGCIMIYKLHRHFYTDFFWSVLQIAKTDY